MDFVRNSSFVVDVATTRVLLNSLIKPAGAAKEALDRFVQVKETEVKFDYSCVQFHEEPGEAIVEIHEEE